MNEIWESMFAARRVMWGDGPTRSALLARDHFVARGALDGDGTAVHATIVAGDSRSEAAKAATIAPTRRRLASRVRRFPVPPHGSLRCTPSR